MEWFSSWMSEDVPLEIACRCAWKVTLFAVIRLCSWVGSLVDSKAASSRARIVALFATKKLFSWMSLHVDSKVFSSCARIVALCANKGLLSAVNSHMGFQLGRCNTREVALVAIVFFLCIMMIIVDFGHLGNFRYFLQRVQEASVNCWNWREHGHLYCIEWKWKWRPWNAIQSTKTTPNNPKSILGTKILNASQNCKNTISSATQKVSNIEFKQKWYRCVCVELNK